MITPLFTRSPLFILTPFSLSLHLFPPSFISPVPVQLAPFCTQPSTRNLIHLVDLARILVERHAYHATYFFSLVHFDSRLDSTFSKSLVNIVSNSVSKDRCPFFFILPFPSSLLFYPCYAFIHAKCVYRADVLFNLAPSNGCVTGGDREQKWQAVLRRYVFTGINRDIGASIDLLTQSVIEISQISPPLLQRLPLIPNYAYGLELDRERLIFFLFRDLSSSSFRVLGKYIVEDKYKYFSRRSSCIIYY